MKPIGVFYATREGHTRHIAERVSADLSTRGFQVDVRNVREKDPSIGLAAYGAVILAASVHRGNHEPEMIRFVKQHRRDLEALPNAFLSVTLSEAGVEQAYRTPAEHAQFAADVEAMIRKLERETNWRPAHVEPVAGALSYSRYNPVKRFFMKQIAKKAGVSTDTSHDVDLTNWAALDSFAAKFADQLAGRSRNIAST